MNPPCQGCERRTVRPNCHATCKEYTEFVKERNKCHENRRKDDVILNYVKDRHKIQRR